MHKIVFVDIDGTLIDDCGTAKPQILSAVIGHIQDGGVEIDKIFGKGFLK